MHERPINYFVPGLVLCERMKDAEPHQLWPLLSRVSRRPARTGKGRGRHSGKGIKGKGRGRGRAIVDAIAPLALEDAADVSEHPHDDGPESCSGESAGETVVSTEDGEGAHGDGPHTDVSEVLDGVVGILHDACGGDSPIDAFSDVVEQGSEGDENDNDGSTLVHAAFGGDGEAPLPGIGAVLLPDARPPLDEPCVPEAPCEPLAVALPSDLDHAFESLSAAPAAAVPPPPAPILNPGMLQLEQHFKDSPKVIHYYVPQFPGARITWYRSKLQFYAYCCDEKTGHSLACRLTRSCRGPTSVYHSPQRGRPLGFMLAWILSCDAEVTKLQSDHLLWIPPMVARLAARKQLDRRLGDRASIASS